MIKSLIFIICYFVLWGYATAQFSAENIDRQMLEKHNGYFDAMDKKCLVSVYGGFEWTSNAFTNSFIKKAFSGNVIEDEYKNQVSKRLGTKNLIGAEFNFGVQSLIYRPQLTYILALGHQEFLSTRFSTDLFQLTFRGNKASAGNILQLAPTNFQYLNYDYFTFGLSKKMNSLGVFGAINLLRGANYLNLDIQKGDFYTSAMGDIIAITHQIKSSNTEGEFSMFPSTKGLGASLNMGINYKFEKHYLSAEMHNLGFIHWISSKQRQSKGNTYVFEGIEIENITQSLNTTNNFDSIINTLNLNTSKNNLSSPVPAKMVLVYDYSLHPKLSLNFSVRHYLFANYNPRLQLKTIYQPSKTWCITPAIAIGGFGNQALEIAVNKTFEKGISVNFNFFVIEYLLVPKNSGGYGLNCSLSKYF